MQNNDTPAQRTPEEVARLKSDWAADGTWDIEKTKGFEAHHDELLAFKQQFEEQEAARHNAMLEEQSVEFGVPGNVKLTGYIFWLEGRLRDFEHRMLQLEERLGRYEGNR